MRMRSSILGRAVAICLAVLMQAPAAQAEDAPDLTLFAAASLGDALAEIAPPGTRLALGGSGAMARQIAQGAPADAVILANTDWMGWLEDGGHVLAESRADILGNRLVLVGPPGAPPLAQLSEQTILDRLGPNGRLAMGAHMSVPAGQYAKLWLETAGLWDALRGRLAETENVRAAFALVARGEVPMAILYASDLVALPGAATQLWAIPQADQPPITYSIAAVTEAGRALVADLSNAAAAGAFAPYGFTAGGTP